jgi:hypothetical protein
MSVGRIPQLVALIAASACLPVSSSSGADSRAKADGAWSERTRLVVDEITQTLARRSVRIWSPADLARFDVSWQPTVNPGTARDQTASGYGRMEWREPGTVPFDSTAVVATFTGEVRAGRPQGYGTYREESGRSYEGTWQQGAMTGSGLLRTPDGKDYQGDVRDGVPHGQGREAAADGTSYQGSFKDGLRDGVGLLMRADGTMVEGVWRAGMLTDEPLPPKDAGLVQYAQATSAATLNVYVDRARNQKDEKESDGGITLYDQQIAGGVLQLRPKIFSSYIKFDLLGTWKGNTRLVRNFPDLAYGSANIVLDVKNNGKLPLQVVDGYVEVAESMTDLQPILNMNSEFEPGCHDDDLKLNPKFSFQNHGWGPVENAKVTYNFTRELVGGGANFTAMLATFADSEEMSVLDGLRNLGVDVQRLERGEFRCESRAAMPQCLRRLVDAKVFGRLPTTSIRFSSKDPKDSASTIVVTDVNGTIEYSWTDAKGAKHSRQSPFTMEIPLLLFKVGLSAECGAGGPSDPDHPTIALKLDQTNYRIPIQYRTTLRPGQNNRLSLSFVAEKSSGHKFRAVLRLSDNSVVQSGPIDLLYFKAREPALPPDDENPTR